MASFKITDLSELAGGSVADTDVLEIVDLDADQSKKVTIASLKTVFAGSGVSEGSSYTGGTSNGIMFNDGNTFATSSNLVFDGDAIAGGSSFVVKSSDGKRIFEVQNSNSIANPVGTMFLSYLGNATGLFLQALGSNKGRFNNAQIGVNYNPTEQFSVGLTTDMVGIGIHLSNGQTADAFQINSFGNTGGNLFKVNKDGYVGIGTTSPVTPFHIHADPAVNGLFAADLVSSISGTQNLFRFGTNGFTSTIFAVKATASVVSFSSWDNNNVIVLNNSGNVGIGATSIDASAKFQIDSTTQGALLPRMTTTQRDAIPSPATGLLIFNTTTKKLDYYSGTAWGQV